MKTDVYNVKNETVGSVDLPASVFGVKWKPELVRQVLIAQLANARRPWAHAKTRAEVRGGGKKPWRQKGTGRARHGSTRSPLWVGGGKSHGPSNKRDYSQKVNKKMRQAAIFSILSRKLKDNQLKVIDSFAFEQAKTKAVFASMSTLLSLPKKTKKVDTLFIPTAENKTFSRIARNLVKVKVSHVGSMNVYDMMNHKNVFVEKEAVNELLKFFSSRSTNAIGDKSMKK
jgi:large subunit ribosomal protein L4